MVHNLHPNDLLDYERNPEEVKRTFSQYTQNIEDNTMRKFPHFNQNSTEYRSFMIKLMRFLEPRVFEPKEIIYQELDNADEMYFVMDGRFDVGYPINRTAKYRL